MNDSTMRAAVIQMTSGAERDANLEAAARLLRAAAEAGACLAVLPENFALMGARETDKLAIAEAEGDGPIQDFLAQSARALGLWIVGGTIPLRVPGDPGHVYASCGVWNARGERIARYDKIHLFDVELPGATAEAGDGDTPAPESYRESATIAPGAPNPVVVDTPIGRLGLSVCYDLRFPELYRRLVAQGAEVLCVPSAFTARTGQAHWEVLLRARAVENLCHVLASNQCGTHAGGRRTWGHSCIVEPWGHVIASCADTPGLAVAVLDAQARRQYRRSFPVLDHRRL
ncbi:nitrilase [Fontimonas thermophila]|uniref:Nitrilase n=1 Tax=Fontimonas thermophila TaxID=1076937 RepID=A0A1I2KBS5_9GAMM|nr:carbon-nitrogen hydrolase family protein [Fontimonas thermophila]SFF63798.1 nitrilase [Fontimonas thermophila]